MNALLMQTYARKLGACLLEMSDTEPCSALDDLHRWIAELISLMVCVSLGNPKGLKAFHSAPMDGSSASVGQLTDSFYADLLVRCLSTHCAAILFALHSPIVRKLTLCAQDTKLACAPSGTSGMLCGIFAAHSLLCCTDQTGGLS